MELLNKKYVGIFLLATLFSWLLHELAHWCAGELLGYHMIMTLNSGYPSSNLATNELNSQFISSAGPLITLIEAVLVYVLMCHKKNIYLYPFLVICFYMRLLATIISIINPNDEARISIALGIGKFTLPIVITSILFFLIFKISRYYKLNGKFNLVNMGLAILFSSMIILSDMYFKIRLI